MSIKVGNEITIRVTCNEKELLNILKNDDFKLVDEYNARDIFMVPKEVNIYQEETRNVISKAIILREFNGIKRKKHKCKITFKHKNINEKGEIEDQDSVNCIIEDINDAKNIFECIGYKKIMEIEEIHFTFKRGNFFITVKILSDTNILIEAEINDTYKTIEELKKEIQLTHIPYNNKNYFVKKAEEELENIKKENK